MIHKRIHDRDDSRDTRGFPLKSKGIAFDFDKHLEGIPSENLKEIDQIVKGIPFEI